MNEGTGPTTPKHRRAIPVPKHPGIFRKGTRYQVRWRHNGRQRARSFRTLSEAARFKAATLSGDTQPTSREPFRNYARTWLESYAGRTARGVSDGTRDSYRDALERLAIPFLGTTPLDRIDPPMLRDYIAHLASKGLAPASVRRAYAPVRALLATAFEDGRIRSNPSVGVRVVVADNRERQPKRLTPAQTRELLAAMPPNQADFAYFLATTGCRISEALASRWRDVGRDDGGRPALTIPIAKTPAGERTIPLSPEAARRLTKRRAEVRFADDDDLIFPSAVGTPLNAHNYRSRIFNPARQRAGVPWAKPHMFRHGVGSLMAEQDLSAAKIAKQLGHADGGVLALRTYVHVDSLESVDFIDAALTGSRDGSTSGSTTHPNPSERRRIQLL
ncbi:MAG: tyrosine-type recombinase/integrase [Solirubrobacteraceae bacterium]